MDRLVDGLRPIGVAQKEVGEYHGRPNLELRIAPPCCSMGAVFPDQDLAVLLQAVGSRVPCVRYSNE